MSTSRDYLDYVLDLLSVTGGITYKKMMGEYLLYRDGVLFGGVYDNRFLVKKLPSLDSYHFKEHIPYPGAKPMLLVDMEDPFEVKAIVENVVTSLTEIKR